MPPCKICSLHEEENLNVVKVFEHWIVREAEPEKNCPGYLYLEPKNHYESFAVIPPDIWTELSLVYPFSFQWIYAHHSPKKVYQVTISEAVPHIHIHLVPRYQEEVKGFDYLSSVVQGKWKP